MDIDWPRVSRWMLLATVVMTAWLLFPVAKCGFAAFKDTPLDEEQPSADNSHVEKPGFFETVGHATKICYARTPLDDQGWKSTLLFVAGGGLLVSWGLGKLQRRR